MSWNKPVIAIQQEPVSPVLWHWLVSGMLIICIGMTCYVLWSGYIRLQQWWIIFGAVGLIWLAAFGLRLYLFGYRLEIYHFWHQERQHIDREWQVWASRYMSVLHNSVFFPEKVTAGTIVQEEPKIAVQYGEKKVIDYFSWSENKWRDSVKILLHSAEKAISDIPPDRPICATVITHESAQEYEKLKMILQEKWQSIFPSRKPLSQLNLVPYLSAMHIEHWLKDPASEVQLLILLQIENTGRFSEGLGVLLMATDDLAQKFELTEKARIYRPMEIDSENFEQQFKTFINTQLSTKEAIGMLGSDNDMYSYTSQIMPVIKEQNAALKLERIKNIEKFIGLAGPGAYWLATGLAIDLSQYHSGNYLVLAKNDRNWTVNTVQAWEEE
ncbi:hypothetical protein TI10_16705 [Photorhabdus luminescens subsp. luminescens]|uniref:Type VI secretion protein n=1 Tax=Photorhabdus luminescens TaxID=29488 RepID=A0A1G5R077_PHOLU|nr:hypothetical protein [Photorhabdus luminescens]KMW72191.1 hypothetical protein TI10_16705 [Photorhabdus luminescens subsp. luminescens]SCZ67366.1 hypothetical protein SAMN02982990_02728 [Photorhabdus luminescens]